MRLQLLTAGESHGPGLTMILEGMPAGLPLDEDTINRDLARRQHGYGAGPRMKIEQDRARLLGGVMDGKTTGAPLSVFIENRDHSRWKDKLIQRFTVPRPGHADLSGVLKYGYDDLRPALERASARETAARVAGGAICRHLLAQFGIRIGGYVISIGEIRADLQALPLEERIQRALTSEVACPDEAAAQAMQARIREIMQARDTLGGVIEAIALGVPPGLGSYVHWERRLDARIAAAVMSIPAIKGVEIGPAFENTTRPGTQVHDPILLADADLYRPGVNSGGLEGGITTGQPIVVRAAMKPIATTLNPQRSVDLAEGREVETRYERSDFCPVPRAVVIVEAMLAFVLADALLEKLGGDSLAEMLPRFAALPRGRLGDVHLREDDPVFWRSEGQA
ncbi:chorismate synthase [Bellilinea caldifistulae]|uniref:Chorismate synthase n=1 Tax=Bellilinea caldifistulae TaxID=360411 RepID=A0A0P6X773_9CHLR|nr:chorismate synthase [Bellilinea caldifistulae]KPL75207.1 chorismate synthase [Bellilinea caldifistulae]GAP09340.1 chorismate synthase [Bellilinea caldifistulae]